MLIAAMLTRYESEVLPTKKNSIREGYYIRRLLTDSFASEDLLTLKTSKIAAYRDRRVREAGPRTSLYELQILSHACTIALSEWDLELPSNPFKKVQKPRQNPSRERRLTEEEFQSLMTALQTARSRYLLPMVQLAVATAMRKGELLSLKWTDIHWNSQHCIITGKTGKRQVPLSKEAISILRDLFQLTGQHSSRRVLGVNDNQFRLAWQRLKKKTGLEDFHFHDLRHESISRYMERGDLTIQEVATISGHKTLNMLWKYTHLQKSSLAARL